MFMLETILVIVIALIGIFAIYKGGQARSRLHAVSAISGAALILCIAVLPALLIQSLLNQGDTPQSQQLAFVVYLLVVVASAITALGCCFRLVFRRTTA